MNEKENELLLWYLLIEGCNWPSGEGSVHVGNKIIMREPQSSLHKVRNIPNTLQP